jgi:cell division protein FtsB
MTTAELHDQLNPEQQLALLALRDEMNTVTSQHDAELGAAHLAAIAAKDADLASAKAKADADLASAKAENDALKATVSDLQSKLGTATAKLADSEAKQLDLVSRARQHFAGLAAVLGEAGMTVDERVAAEKEAQAVALEKKIAELRA